MLLVCLWNNLKQLTDFGDDCRIVFWKKFPHQQKPWRQFRYCRKKVDMLELTIRSQKLLAGGKIFVTSGDLAQKN